MPEITPKACQHVQLRFVSAGFHLICAHCGVRWVAQMDTDLGPRPDYARVDQALDQQMRVKL